MDSELTCAAASLSFFGEEFQSKNRSVISWGKIDLHTGERHHLAHHSADVAAVLMALLSLSSFNQKASTAIGRPISNDEIACLGALAFLHDIGKLAPAFQAKGWVHHSSITRRGHIQCGWKWLAEGDAAEALAGHAQLFAEWPDIAEWFRLLFAHHGRPVPCPDENWGQDAFAPVQGYDWKVQERVMGEALVSWFPEIRQKCPPPLTPAFAHYFAGLLSLADWIGSDRGAFDFVPEFDPDYWSKARLKAQKRLAEIGLDTRNVYLSGPAQWPLVSAYPAPRPAQEVVASIPLDERLVLLEAETGAGKTEAALWRFAKLFEADEVEGLYFAVPTRAAARQLQGRVNKTLKRMFRAPVPEAVLAIPGQAVAGDAKGIRLPEFRMRWDDTMENRPSRWAAEHATRFLAAQIAVGTVDQVMMAGLQVKHAHLRGSALSRSLLVIDEVHASDAWMTEIQQRIVNDHLALGGHVLMMSATLGSVARAKWRQEPMPSLAEAESEKYPVVWTKRDRFPMSGSESAEKRVRIKAHHGWSGEDGADFAVQAAREGARVLVIRNTVDRARETWKACVAREPELVFELEGAATLHHSRFAAEDRSRLDARVEEIFGAGGAAGGVILVGTQTLEQSLDIDADFLITDLCPMDVLLQRIGRLHRHDRSRPKGFESPATVVLCPEGGLDPLTREPENGLGAYGRNKSGSLSGVYLDVPGIAATLAEIESHPNWIIPKMNRSLVERATHPERLDKVARENGWEDYRRRVTGKAIAEAQGATLVVLDRTQEFPESFPDDDVIRTRLGEMGAVLSLPEGTYGPFGQPIRTLALPVHWSRGLAGDEPVEIETVRPLTFRVLDRLFTYDASGLQRQED